MSTPDTTQAAAIADPASAGPLAAPPVVSMRAPLLAARRLTPGALSLIGAMTVVLIVAVVKRSADTRQTAAPFPLDFGGASRRTAGLSPGEARGRERSDIDSRAAGATIIRVQGGGRPAPTAFSAARRLAWRCLTEPRPDALPRSSRQPTQTSVGRVK